MQMLLVFICLSHPIYSTDSVLLNMHNYEKVDVFQENTLSNKYEMSVFRGGSTFERI